MLPVVLQQHIFLLPLDSLLLILGKMAHNLPLEEKMIKSPSTMGLQVQQISNYLILLNQVMKSHLLTLLLPMIGWSQAAKMVISISTRQIVLPTPSTLSNTVQYNHTKIPLIHVGNAHWTCKDADCVQYLLYVWNVLITTI